MISIEPHALGIISPHILRLPCLAAASVIVNKPVTADDMGGGGLRRARMESESGRTLSKGSCWMGDTTVGLISKLLGFRSWILGGPDQCQN